MLQRLPAAGDNSGFLQGFRQACFREKAGRAGEAEVDPVKRKRPQGSQMSVMLFAGQKPVSYTHLVYLNGENVTDRIRAEEVGMMASLVSSYAAVREKLTQLQQKMAEKQDVVMDGRDIGTAVLPRAQVKVYLTADAEVRAMRRYAELQARGEMCDMEAIKADILRRDSQDMNRAISPLKKAPDAIEVDCSHMTIDEVVSVVVKQIMLRRG